MKKSEILGDDSIKKIALENIDKDHSEINIVADIEDSPVKRIIGTIFASIGLVLFCIALFVSIYIYINMYIVQGNIEGANFHIGDYSIVSKNYTPDTFLREGQTVYYDSKGQSFIMNSNNFTKGKIARVGDKKVALSGTVKDTSINIKQINYVIK